MTLTAKDIMQTEIIKVTSDMTLSEVSDLLFREGITGAPVVEPGRKDSPGAVLGVISRSDLVRFPLYQDTVAGILSEHFRDLAAAEGEPSEPSTLPEGLQDVLSAHTAREAMAMSPVTVGPDTPVLDVAQTMVSQHLHRVLVVDGDTLVGLISALDIVGLVAAETDI